MGKRKQGGGKKRRREAITRRDRDAKQQRRSEREADEDDDGDSADGDSADGDDSADDPEEIDDDGNEGDDGDGDDDDDDEASADDGDDGPHDSQRPGRPEGAKWARPLVKFEHAWTWFEVRLLFVSLCFLILFMAGMISLNGLNQPLETEAKAGIVYRALFGASVLGGITYAVTRRLKLGAFTIAGMSIGIGKAATAGALLAGILLAGQWREVGIQWASRVQSWLTSGSVVSMMGGPDTFGARVLMLVAMIGASLAAATNQHILIDAVVRLIPKKFRVYINVLSSLATVGVCVIVAYALFSWIAITGYGAPAELTEDEVAQVVKEGRDPTFETFGKQREAVVESLGDQFFIFRKQLKLDLGALPTVVKGGKVADRMTGREWNQWVDENGLAERYPAEVQKMKALDHALDRPRQAYLLIPGKDAKELKKGLDLVFPLGFLMMALRLLLRTLLVLAGHIEVKLEGELDEEELQRKKDESDGDLAEDAA